MRNWRGIGIPLSVSVREMMSGNGHNGWEESGGRNDNHGNPVVIDGNPEGVDGMPLWSIQLAYGLCCSFLTRGTYVVDESR